MGIFGVFRRVLRFAENGVDIHINSVVDELESKNKKIIHNCKMLADFFDEKSINFGHLAHKLKNNRVSN